MLLYGECERMQTARYADLRAKLEDEASQLGEGESTMLVVPAPSDKGAPDNFSVWRADGALWLHAFDPLGGTVKALESVYTKKDFSHDGAKLAKTLRSYDAFQTAGQSEVALICYDTRDHVPEPFED